MAHHFIARERKIEAIAVHLAGKPQRLTAKEFEICVVSLSKWMKQEDLVNEASILAENLIATRKLTEDEEFILQKEQEKEDQVKQLNEFNEKYREILNNLSERDSEIIKKYELGKNASSLGRSFNLSRQRVHQILVDAQSLGITLRKISKKIPSEEQRKSQSEKMKVLWASGKFSRENQSIRMKERWVSGKMKRKKLSLAP